MPNKLLSLIWPGRHADYGVAIYSALAFDIQADGVTDDRLAIQDAVDYIEGKGGGALVLPPERTTLWTGQIKLGNNVQLVGAPGAVLKLKDNALFVGQTSYGITAKPGIDFCAVRDLEIDGNYANQDYLNFGNGNVNNLVFKAGFSGIDGTDHPKWLLIDKVYSHDAVRNCLMLKSHYPVPDPDARGLAVVTSCRLKNSIQDHLLYLTGGEPRVMGLTLEGFAKSGLFKWVGGGVIRDWLIDNIAENPEAPTLTTLQIGNSFTDDPTGGDGPRDVPLHVDGFHVRYDPSITAWGLNPIDTRGQWRGVVWEQVGVSDTLFIAIRNSGARTLVGCDIDMRVRNARQVNVAQLFSGARNSKIRADIELQAGVVANANTVFVDGDIDHLDVELYTQEGTAIGGALSLQGDPGAIHRSVSLSGHVDNRQTLVSFDTADCTFEGIAFRDLIANFDSTLRLAAANAALKYKTVWDNVIFPNDITPAALAKIRAVDQGIATFSGDGAVTDFTIDTGVVQLPGPLAPNLHFRVWAQSADAAAVFWVRQFPVSETKIQVRFLVAPPAGVDNVILGWEARIA